MPIRPVECPACGHEGISRGAQQPVTGARRADELAESWTCRLCAYTWTAAAPGRKVMEGPDVAHPS